MRIVHSGRRPRRLVVAATLLGLLAAACGPSTPPLAGPEEILEAAASSLETMDTVHLRGTVDGPLPIDAGGTGGLPLTLDGTTLEADVDLPAAALALEVLAPAVLNLRLDVVVVDGTGYVRAPIITGESWARLPAEGGLGGDPGAAFDGLAALLRRPGLEAEQLPDRRCAGTDCQVVRIEVPVEEVRAALGDLGSAIPGLGAAEPGAVAVTIGVRRDNQELGTMVLEVEGDGTDPLVFALELSRVNEPVTITPPPADEVTDTPLGLPGG